MTLITNTGREIECSQVIPGRLFPVLHIYTGTISPGDAFAIFNNPEETKKLVAVDDDGRRVYRNYTMLQSVGPTTMQTGEQELMIWLNYYEPETEFEEE